ncbi:MAG: M1 family metallopeptidase [Clostridiales bacterium]|nr:M1 family metallopeptidase [Clostridiales bacterium]
MKKLVCVFLIASLLLFSAFASSCEGQKDISTYIISAKYDEEEKTLTATMDFTFFNDTEREISDLKFNLYGNAFRQGAVCSPVYSAYRDLAYYNGESYGSMSVLNVENCSAWDVAGEDENILRVNLSSPVKPNGRAQIKVNYELKLAEVNHRTGVTQKTVNLGNFYPVLCALIGDEYIEATYSAIGDPFVSNCANYTVNFDLPQGYTAATSGRRTLNEDLDKRVKQSFEIENARDFAAVLSKDFLVETRQVDGVEVSYYYYKDDAPQAVLNATAESLQYFSQAFGSYAYSTLSVVQTGFCYGGMEYPALTMISDTLNESEAIYTTVHETAHQWWYAAVGSDQINSAWQDEGLTEYSTLMFFENTPDYGFTKTGLIGSATKSYRAYFSVYKQLFDEVNTAMNRPLNEFLSDYEYTNIAYNKGLILFDTLRNSIGDEKFIACLKNYYGQNAFKIASVDDLYSAFNSCGTDLKGFFESFVEGKIII